MRIYLAARYSRREELLGYVADLKATGGRRHGDDLAACRAFETRHAGDGVPA